MFERIKLKLRRKFINLLVRHLFAFPTEEDILSSKDGQIYYKGAPLKLEVINALISQARTIKDTLFYQILLDELRYDAAQRMFQESKSTDDLYVGKTALYLIDLIKKIVDKTANPK